MKITVNETFVLKRTGKYYLQGTKVEQADFTDKEIKEAAGRGLLTLDEPEAAKPKVAAKRKKPAAKK